MFILKLIKFFGILAKIAKIENFFISKNDFRSYNKNKF